jgi:hypothetical protein
MSSPVIETPAAAAPATPPAEWSARGRRLAALGLIVLGLIILALNLGLLPAAAAQAAAVIWPAGVIALGVGWLVLGDRIWQGAPAPFQVARGEAQDAELVVQAGLADLLVQGRSEPADLARGELPRSLRPQTTWREQHATLRLATLWGLPAVGRGRWAVALAADLPWRLDLGSSTGHLTLDLSGLTPQGVQVRSTFGDVDLTLPEAGGADLDLRLTFGDLTITVPDGLGVKVTVDSGALAEVVRDERRFIQLAPQEIGTPLYAVAVRRCTLVVRLGTGRLQLK